MITLLQGVAATVVGRGYLATDHISDATGLDPAITISKNGGTFTAPSGTALMDEIATTSSWYKYTLGTGDTDTLGPLIIKATHATMDPIEIVCQVVAAVPDVNASKVGGQTASAAGAVTFPGTVASPTNITAGTIATITNDVGITQTGADKVWATAARALTDKAGFSLSATGLDLILHGATFMVALATAVWELGTRTLSAFSFTPACTVSDKTGFSLTVTPPTAAEIVTQFGTGSTLTACATATTVTASNMVAEAPTVDDILDEAVEGSITLRQAIRALLAFSVGKATGGGGTSITLKAADSTSTRVVMTVDENGNRSAVTLTL